MKSFTLELDGYYQNCAVETFISELEDQNIISFDVSMLNEFLVNDTKMFKLATGGDKDKKQAYIDKFLATEPDSMLSYKMVCLEEPINAKDGILVNSFPILGAKKFKSIYEVRVELPEGESYKDSIPGYKEFIELNEKRSLELREKFLIPWEGTTQGENLSAPIAEFIKADDAKKFAKDYAVITDTKTVVVASKCHVEGPRRVAEVIKSETKIGRYLFMLKVADTL